MNGSGLRLVAGVVVVDCGDFSRRMLVEVMIAATRDGGEVDRRRLGLAAGVVVTD